MTSPCRRWFRRLFGAVSLAAASLVTVAPAQDVTPHGGMLRYPDVSARHLVFVYANDLWLADRTGGTATPLASPPGGEEHPKFSPDGRSIAFVGNYDGDRDLYTLPTEGGIPFRVTHHPSNETLWDWSTGDRLVFSMNGLSGLRRQAQLFRVSPDGGLPEKLPVPYGAHGAISADQQWLAYTPHSRQTRTWKRYRGGQATDIWLFHLGDKTSRRITDWEGTDSVPMWVGSKVYYLSDAGPAHRLNLWSFDPETSTRVQITHFRDYDVKWPSMGPGASGNGEIVFQNGSGLFLLDLESRAVTKVEIRLPGARPKLRPRKMDVSDRISSSEISARGNRVVVEARGDIWTLPAEHGTPRQITRTDHIAERDPSWSPDGRWIAYFSDETGEYELTVIQSDGKGDPRQLTNDGGSFRYSPTWSPDSKHIAFSNKAGQIKLHTVETSQTVLVDTDPSGRVSGLNWSHDSGWITYARTTDTDQSAIWLYHLAEARATQATAGFFQDTWPTFDREGKYLFFASHREFTQPVYEDIGTTFAYANTDRLIAVPLRKDVASPWLPKSDEETWDDEAKDDREDEDSSEASDDSDDSSGTKEEETKEIEPLVIDLEDFERRALLLPVLRGNFAALAVTHDHKLVYVRRPASGSDGKPSIRLFDLNDEKREEKTAVAGESSFQLSADGKKMLVRSKGRFAIVEVGEDQKLEKFAPTHGMESDIDPRREWAQILRDAWRIQRDFFYDPNMHGVDWNAVHGQYAAMLPDCANREDVSYLIREMISELNVGHAYYWGGDVESQPNKSVGLLGCDFELDSQGGHRAYRIARIQKGAAWDVNARGPLDQPGLDVSEGDYLLAVDGARVDTSRDPWAAFIGLAGHAVPITVSKKPFVDEDARQIVVKPISNATSLRFRSWIEKNREYVDAKSNGEIGYIYVPDTGINGQNELVRQFYGQRRKKALIVDERWNGGGQIPTRFIELLNRPVTNYWAVRDGRDWVWPPDSHQGPKCMLINGLAGSGGDMFPALFKQAGLGPLIGTRTWGGLVGISGNPSLIDGGYTSAPTFAYYETDGTWGIEGHGVDPDVEVLDDPAKMLNGGDPQLDTAIHMMLEAVRAAPPQKAPRPQYPNRRGMGLPSADK